MDVRNTYRVKNLINVKLHIVNAVQQTLNLKEVQSFLNNTAYNFDLVLNECWYSDVYLAVGHRYNKVLFLIIPNI